MKVTKIIETALYVDNLDEAEEFYTKILGLKLYKKRKGRHVFLVCGDSMLLLFNPNETSVQSDNSPKHGTKGQGHIAFLMMEEDISSWEKYLKKVKIPIEKKTKWDRGGYSIYFRDPSGNSIELTTAKTWSLRD